jgi:O-6-methylguanine DNA methyltransferase
MSEPVAVAVLGSPHGPIQAAASSRGVCSLELHTTPEAFRERLRASGMIPVQATDGAGAHLVRLQAELDDYWRGDRRVFGLPLDPRIDSAFDRRVLAAVGTIPYGATASYGEVARRAGSPGAARAVGGAVGRNPVGLLIPCHRVIAADGTIGGYGGSWSWERGELLALKRALLLREGIVLRDGDAR